MKNKLPKILTEHLIKVLEEPCDFPITIGGEQKIVTKGEALARQMIASALGYREEIDIYDKDGNVTGTRETFHSPDKTLAKEILDRVEGKAATMTIIKEKEKITVADKVTEQGTKRLNKLAKVSSLKI